MDSDATVTVNGTELDDDTLQRFQAQYGVRPPPGRYWYDARSGLQGIWGQPAAGFLLPGHDFGFLARDASAGNTGVLINGRELPHVEWLNWSGLLGAPIQGGAYWLDGNGNAGYEGNPMPVVNFLLAAQQRAGAGGDNIWSTRFSAGNYDSGNQRGYVSVPGYGPIGYGF